MWVPVLPDPVSEACQTVPVVVEHVLDQRSLVQRESSQNDVLPDPIGSTSLEKLFQTRVECKWALKDFETEQEQTFVRILGNRHQVFEHVLGSRYSEGERNS